VPVTVGLSVNATATTAMAGLVYDRPLGAAIRTVSDSENVVAPVLFDAVIVYGAAATAAVGVPEITPVVGLRVNPAGKAGATV
jgi:hypothetical protein